MRGSASRPRVSGRRATVAVLALATVTLAAACGSSEAPTATPPTTGASASSSGSSIPSGSGSGRGSSTSTSTSTTTVRGPGGTRAPGSTTALPSASVPNAELEATIEATDVTWLANPSEYRGQPNARVAYECTPDGDPSSVWGVDIYTDDSSVCTAAVHAGLITLAQGGRVVIEIRDGLEAYEGGAANGITTLEYAVLARQLRVPGRVTGPARRATGAVGVPIGAPTR